MGKDTYFTSDNKDTYFTSDNIEKLNFLLRAKLDDYCLPDGTVVHIDGLLFDYFKRGMGYDNIVFFSPNKGLYFFEEETYDYFCPPTNLDDLSKTVPLSANVGALQSRRSKNDGGDGGQRLLASTTARETVQEKRLRFAMSFKEAFPRIEMLIKDRKHKNVVVIKDAVSFLESVGEQNNGTIKQDDEAFFLRNWDNLLYDRGQNKNILIWVTMGRDNVAGYPYFRDRNAAESAPQLAKEKLTVIETSVIGTGEIANLINHYRLRMRGSDSVSVFCGLRVDFSEYGRLCAYIAEKMLRYSLSLRDLGDIFETLIQKNAVLGIETFNDALREKLIALKLKFEADESYLKTLAKFDKQPKIEEFIESMRSRAEGFHINEQRAAAGDSRLDPPQRTEFQKLLARQQNAFNLHLALVGPPGTGKTTFAKIIAKAYRELGLLPSEKFVKVTRADLVGAYVGHTAIKTRSVIESAMGGTLFIDEAYTLARSGANGGNDFGLEAIDTLVEAMTDRMGEFAVIIAGYENDIKKMISANEGLQSRFGSIISMSPYPVETLERKFESTVLDIAEEYGDLDKNAVALSALLCPRDRGGFLGDFIEALQRDYDLHKENGRSGWASMRTVIQLATNTINNCRRRLNMSNLRRGEVILEDLPEHEREIFASIVKGKSSSQAEEAAEKKEKLDIAKPFAYGQIMHWAETNPAFLLSDDRGEKFRSVYQSAVVKLYRYGTENSGSGCLISPNGYILTAKHVAVDVNTARIFYTVKGRSISEEHPVKIAYQSDQYDIAVMQIADGASIPFYASLWMDGARKFAAKETHVYLMGYPFGLQAIDGAICYQGNVAGVSVEARDRDSSQTQAMLNLQIEGKRGNSGSPLFNDAMEIVGVFVGSQTQGDESLMEEINRALPIRYFFEEFVG